MRTATTLVHGAGFVPTTHRVAPDRPMHAEDTTWRLIPVRPHCLLLTKYTSTPIVVTTFKYYYYYYYY